MGNITEKLFYEDAYLKMFEAKVTDCREVQEKGGQCRFETELDRTAFFPEGGGQYADTGMIAEAHVLDVQEKDGRILHYTDRAVDTGSLVTGIIDWDERFMKMQQHTGEHIVSGLVHAGFGYDNVGFHLGSEDCTMDFNGEITADQLARIEYEANQAVWKNLQVHVLYPSKEELEEMEYRSKIEIQGQVRIVEIPGYDRCACCAPHVERTGEIGLIKLTNVQRYKGGVRVTMLCGVRALEDYAVKQKQAKEVSAMLCAKENETAEAVHHLQKEYSALKYELGEKEKQLVRCRAEMIPAGEVPVCVFPDGLEGESMRLLMNEILEAGHSLCAVFQKTESREQDRADTAAGTEQNYRYVMGSRSMDVRPLARTFQEKFAGRGGGRPEMVQGTVKGSEKEIRAWIIGKAGETE